MSPKAKSIALRLLAFLVAMGAGWQLFGLFVGKEPVPPAAKALPDQFDGRGNGPPADDLLRNMGARVGLPLDIEARMQGHGAPAPDKSRKPASDLPPDYAFTIAEHQFDQISAMKENLQMRPDLQHQEDGVTVESLDRMARERRMAW